MGTATSKSNLAVTSIKIERDRLEAFKEVARANRRTVSQELRWLIDRSVEAHLKERAA